MTHGPSYTEGFGFCIYCLSSECDLTDEHVVPYALGGQHVIRKASCRACAKVTSRFERKVTRGMWGDARIAFDMPSRRKKARPARFSVPSQKPGRTALEIPANEYPAGFVFYRMSKAGLLAGIPSDIDISNSWKLVMIDDDQRRERFLKTHSKELQIQFRHQPVEFAKLLAKIGYCNVLTALKPDDFRDFCRPHILGKSSNLSYIVGGCEREHPPDENLGYNLQTFVLGSDRRAIIVCAIRLLANAHTPLYHVVVGDLSGSEQVASALYKLGYEESSQPTKVGLGKDAHYLPSVYPLAYWREVPK